MVEEESIPLSNPVSSLDGSKSTIVESIVKQMLPHHQGDSDEKNVHIFLYNQRQRSRAETAAAHRGPSPRLSPPPPGDALYCKLRVSPSLHRLLIEAAPSFLPPAKSQVSMPWRHGPSISQIRKSENRKSKMREYSMIRASRRRVKYCLPLELSGRVCRHKNDWSGK